MGGGFRAPLAVAIPSTDAGKVQAVGLNSSGQVTIGAAAAVGIKGVICPVRAMAAGEIIDVMTDGEIVNATMTAGTAMVAGVDVWGAFATGLVTQTQGTGAYIGHTVELDRLVVRVGR